MVTSITKSSVNTWSLYDDPRYKLRSMGASSLSNAELIAMLLSTGDKEQTAVELSQQILKTCEGNLNELGKRSFGDLMRIKGIGEAKACLLISAIELGRRRSNCEFLSRQTVRTSGDIASYLKTALQDYPHEVFGVLFLNRSNKILSFEIISVGGLTGTVADPRVILKKALEWNATAIVVCHNHPSGNLKPSRADEELTQKIKHAASFLDVRLIDHLVVSSEGFYSFSDEGLL